MKLRQTLKWSNHNDVLIITKERREDTETWQRRDWVFPGIIPKWRPRACFVFELWRLFANKRLYYYWIMTWLDTVIVKALKTSHDLKKVLAASYESAIPWKTNSWKSQLFHRVPRKVSTSAYSHYFPKSFLRTTYCMDEVLLVLFSFSWSYGVLLYEILTIGRFVFTYTL